MVRIAHLSLAPEQRPKPDEPESGRPPKYEHF